VQDVKSPAIYANLLNSIREEGTDSIPLRIVAVKKAR